METWTYTSALGFYLTQEIVKREDVVVFAGARNPEGATELAKLAKASENRVHAVKLDLGNKWDLDAVVKNIKEVAGKLDVVIGNAGICNVYGSPLEMTAQDMRDHFEVRLTLCPPFVEFASADSTGRSTRLATSSFSRKHTHCCKPARTQSLSSSPRQEAA